MKRISVQGLLITRFELQTQLHDRLERSWNVKKKNSAKSTELIPLTASEYKRWLEAVWSASYCLRVYGNWSAPPWIIRRCGEESVLNELSQRLGKPLTMKKSVYPGLGQQKRRTYYIIEVKKS